MEHNRFTELFDNTGSSRVLDMLIGSREYDYAITDENMLYTKLVDGSREVDVEKIAGLK